MTPTRTALTAQLETMVEERGPAAELLVSYQELLERLAAMAESEGE